MIAVVVEHLADLFDGVFGVQFAVVRDRRAGSVVSIPEWYRSSRSASRGCNVLEQFGQDRFHIADNRHVRLHHFADFRRINVNVNDFRAGGELVHIAGHAVIEARADRNQQVGCC